MNDIRYDLAGSSVFWSLGGGTNYTRLAAMLSTEGFGQFTPERMTEYASLRAAIAEHYTDCEVYPVKGEKNTFEVIRVTKDENTKRNEYTRLATISLGKYGVVHDNDFHMEALLQAAYDRYRSTVHHSSVSRALVDIVMALGGTTLRPSGGVYWIPNDHWDRWCAVVQAVETSGPSNNVFSMRVIYDEHSAAAIREALTAEIEREASNIASAMDELVSNNCLKKAAPLKSRAECLRIKLSAYEESFGFCLQNLAKQLQDATTIQATMCLMESAASIGDFT